MTCPHCSLTLTPTHPRATLAPPWHCTGCSRLWWQAELTPAARAAWNPATASFGTDEASQMVRLTALVQRDDALTAHRARPATPGEN